MKRPFTWVILVINTLFLVWLIAGVVSATSDADCASEATQALRDACESGTAVGSAIGAGIIIFLWAAVDVILGVIWLVTRPRASRHAEV